MTTYITSSAANTEGFIPSIWAQEALQILRNNIVLAKFVARDSDFGEGAFATVGQTLYVGYAGTFTASDKTANTLLTAAVPTGGSSTSVTLNKYKVIPFVVENIAQAQSNQNLMQRLLEPAVVALAEQVESDLWGTAISFSPVGQGTIGTGLTSSSLQQAAKTLNIKKAPTQDRHVIVSPGDLANLENDSGLQSYFAFNAGEGMVEDGVPNRPLYGLNLHMSQLVPTYNSGTVAHSVFTLATTGTPTGGYSVLTYASNASGHIAYNANAATVEAALNAITGVSAGQFRCSGTWATNGTITVVNLGASPTAVTSDAGANLTGGSSPTVTVADAATTVTPNINLALHKNAMLLASRPVRPAGGSTVLSAMIQDDVSGLTLNMEAQYSIQSMGLWVNLSMLYGVVALRPDQAQVVLS
jgi:hypothetical protein